MTMLIHFEKDSLQGYPATVVRTLASRPGCPDRTHRLTQ